LTKIHRSTKSLNVQREILEALLILMSQKKFQDISITELCQKAGTSRMAFYRNFNFLRDVLVRHLDTLFEQYVEEMSSISFKGAFDFALKLFVYHERHKRFLKLLMKAGLQTILLERFDKYLVKIFENLLHREIQDFSESYFRVEFISGGLYKILIAWLSQNAAQPAKAMAKIVASFFP